MDKDINSQTLDSVAAAGQQMQISIDDASAAVSYSSLVRVGGSAEELMLDFAGPLRPVSPRAATMKVDNRIIMSPWAAKRLSMALQQAIERYEQAYGPLEIDERKRRQGSAQA